MLDARSGPPAQTLGNLRLEVNWPVAFWPVAFFKQGHGAPCPYPFECGQAAFGDPSGYGQIPFHHDGGETSLQGEIGGSGKNKGLHKSMKPLCKNGAPGEIRTPGQMLRRHLLYPPELQAQMVDFTFFAELYITSKAFMAESLLAKMS